MPKVNKQRKKAAIKKQAAVARKQGKPWSGRHNPPNLKKKSWWNGVKIRRAPSAESSEVTG